jgi:cytochrome b561
MVSLLVALYISLGVGLHIITAQRHHLILKGAILAQIISEVRQKIR